MANGTVVLTKNELVRTLYELAKAHFQINGFGYGNLNDISVATVTSFEVANDETPKSSNEDRCPIMWVTPIRLNLTGKELYYNFDVVIADLVKKDGNIFVQNLEVESDTMLICLDICAMLDNQFKSAFYNTRNTTIDPFTERFDDDYTGHIATISLKTPFNYNNCQVPAYPIVQFPDDPCFPTPTPPDECCLYTDDVEVILEDGKSLGQYVNGDIIPAAGKTIQEVLILLAQEVLVPTITMSTVNNQREVGGSGSIQIKWSVTKGSLPITSIIIAGEVISPTGENQSGFVIVNTTTTDGLRTFNGSVSDGETTQNTSTSVRYSYVIFEGSALTKPTNSAEVRALPVSGFDTLSTLNYTTGTTNTFFCIALPPGISLVSVIDLTNLNLNITSQFTSESISVNDAGGNPVNYTMWTMNTAIPYNPSATHQVTFN